MTTSLAEIALVVCDIDGTLTHDGTIYPSPYTLEIIEKLHERGIAFGLASGRGADQLVQLAREWKLSFPLDLAIGLNGSEYYDHANDEMHSLYTLSEKDIEAIITQMVKAFPDINCSIYSEGMRLLRYEDQMAINSRKRNNMENRIVSDLSEMWAKPCSKVMFRVDEETMARIEPLAKAISSERYRCCKTQTTMMEFVHAQANKGNALKRYCENNGTDLSQVMAFGDMSNDNELLQSAGIGVCMINGSPDCKECADFITAKTNNEDGCAAFIEEYLL